MSSSISPGLVVLHGNQLEQLRDAVIDWIGQNPLDPLEAEHFLVQSNGVAEWLKISLAEHGGICAAHALMLPARFLWQSYRAMLGRENVPQRSAFDKDALTWRLMHLLPTLVTQAPFAPLQRFLADGDAERRLQLAQRLADLFDQYQVYRADWLQDWSQGRDVLRLAGGDSRALAPDQCWQALLWRAIGASVDPALPGRAQVHRAFLAGMAAGEPARAPLPRRVVLFGISALPAQTLEALAALASRCQVLMVIPNPCQFYWGDIIDGRELLQSERRRQAARGGLDLSTVALEDLHQHSHPLLAGWGRQGRDFIRLLDQFDDAEAARQRFPNVRIDLFSEGEAPQLLGQVQDAIRDLLPLDEHPQRQVAQDDGSIEFHVTHSAQREVEVLHDQLLSWFARKDAAPLQPRDVVVMVPDIESFAAAIHAVFEQYGHHDARFIPYEIADVKDRSINPLLNALDWLLRLPSQRCRQSEVRDLLDVPALAARFGLDDETGRARLAAWIDGCGIRWGLDGAHRAGLGLGSAGEQNSWLFGIRRMLLGYAVGGECGFQGVEPYAEVGGLDAALAGSLAQVIDALIHWRVCLAAAATPGQWAARARALLQAFFVETDDQDRLTLCRLETSLQRWLESCAEAGFDEALPLAVLREAWLAPMDEPTLNHRFVSGGVTFCTLMPMRAIPFRALCLLGMNDGDYPRHSSRADFDLLAEPGLARPGDRSRHDDDRYLMLEALLAARDKLYVSWVGHNIRDNSAQPPSVLVAQLRDYLQAGWGLDLAQLTTEHPLQPFSRRYFEQGGLLTYAREWRSAHGAQATAAPALAPYVPPQDAHLGLRELADFIRHPARQFFRRRLGVYFNEEQVISEDDEPFGLDALEEFHLADTLLSAARGAAVEQDQLQTYLQSQLQRQAMAGCLPIGLIGQRLQAQWVRQLTPVCQAWLQWCARYPLPAEKLPVAVAQAELRLEDWLDQLRCPHEGGATVWLSLSASRLWDGKRKQPRADKLVQAWLRQLLAAAQEVVVTGLLVGRDATVQCAPLQPADACAELGGLLQAWRAGMAEPWPSAFMSGLALIAGEDAAKVYDGDYNLSGEVQLDPCLARLWPDFAALSAEEQWPAATRLLYGGFHAWLQQHVTVILHPVATNEAEAE
jgi:exodeoxyribonuclease V gamma subunit